MFGLGRNANLNLKNYSEATCFQEPKPVRETRLTHLNFLTFISFNSARSPLNA